LDERFLATAMEKYGDSVLRVAASITGNLPSAEDVFSCVFFTLWQLKKTFSCEGHLKAWLIRVAVNKAKNVKNQAYNRHRAELNESVAATEMEPNCDVPKALARLKPAQRAVLYLHYYEGYTYAEIATMLNLRESNVRSVALRARGQMKNFLS
jgi:RNA polymerase sigma-70 factor (ECF subfamily)